MYDVIVIGGGHAGSEACLAAARLGKKTLLVTGNIKMIASMPCNPSVGGPAKGIVVREIDALGGEMARNADKTQIQMTIMRKMQLFMTHVNKHKFPNMFCFLGASWITNNLGRGPKHVNDPIQP